MPTVGLWFGVPFPRTESFGTNVRVNPHSEAKNGGVRVPRHNGDIKN